MGYKYVKVPSPVVLIHSETGQRIKHKDDLGWRDMPPQSMYNFIAAACFGDSRIGTGPEMLRRCNRIEAALSKPIAGWAQLLAEDHQILRDILQDLPPGIQPMITRQLGCFVFAIEDAVDEMMPDETNGDSFADMLRKKQEAQPRPLMQLSDATFTEGGLSPIKLSM